MTRLHKKRNILLKSNLFALIIASAAFAQEPIPISINSNDPAFPFPQFQPYVNPSATLGNVGTHNSVGVPHAEMEKTIKDAYRIMMNRAEKPGGGVGGIDYIYYKSEPTCTEGDGYAMLGAVAMADKPTFDGLWLWIHDNAMNKVKRYSDCQESSPGYRYSQLPGWKNVSNDNSAADGDFDIALALLCAYKQWGEFMGVNDACGNPISYKQAAVDFIKALTDTLIFVSNGSTWLSGDIGFDGYFKGGDSWQELTDWANDPARSGVNIESKGPQEQWFDYTAPSYFRQFGDFLSEIDSAKYAWNIKQFRRAEASSDWLMGQMLKNPAAIPIAGKVSIGSDNVPVFRNANQGEDFRLGWRTILNYVWHGNPSSTWDPVSHQVIQGTPNTFERDMGLRFARFLWDPRQDPWKNPCVAGADDKFTYWGPHVLWTFWTLNGTDGEFFFLNWIHSVGSPSAVISQDFNLMSEMYRQLELEWDVDTPGDGYLTSVPHYFHGWFRVLGLLVLSGNYHSPAQLVPTANMKVYLDIDKTFAFEKDTVTYTIDYRNYGSLDAQNVVIVDTLHPDFQFQSATDDGIFNASANTVTWNIGSVSGFKTATGIEPTRGQVKLVVKVAKATRKQYRNRVSISCANGSGWASNEYPNNITSVMERNYLDIAKRALIVNKTASAAAVNPGKEIEFTIEFENTSDAGWINGGRPGVHLSYASAADPANPAMNTMKVRLFHHAQEAYIDYGNYRISYYLFDPGLKCYQGTADCQTGWGVQPTITEGLDKNFIKILHENITPGEDANGKWNQRIIIQFSDPLDPARVENLAAIDHHLREYAGMQGRIHKGGTMPLRLAWNLFSGNWTAVNWADDWSWDPQAQDDDGGVYWPITGDWTDLDNPDIPVNNWDPKSCKTADYTVDNVLVEEWDGYTWRRVFGNGPLPGREAVNVVVRDTIPAGFTFSQFTGKFPFDIEPTVSGNIITWTIPKLQIKEKGTITYKAIASGVCPVQSKDIMTRAWISADKESPVYDSVSVLVTCDSIPPPPPPPTTFYKLANTNTIGAGDTVIYTLAYKQTHGNMVTDASDISKWNDVGGAGKLGIGTDGTISYNIRNARMVYSQSYGVNGTIGGTLKPATYSEFAIVARDDGTNFVEIRMKQEYRDMWIKFYNNATQVGGEQRFTYTGFPAAFDFKIKLSEDTISFWAGDTSALLPNVRQNGISVRTGFAGVKSLNDPGTTLSGWSTHFDMSYDIVISDALPDGLTFISAGGEISTGALAGTQLTVDNTNGTVNWRVVSGNDALNHGDSVTVWIKALCHACTVDSVINTAYTNMRGIPANSIAAQLRTPCMVEAGNPDHLDIVVDTLNINLRNDTSLEPVFMDAGTLNYRLYAVIRDEKGVFIEKANIPLWISRDETVVTVSGQPGSPWGGLVTRAGSGQTVIVVNKDGLKPDSVTIIAEAAPPWPVISTAVMADENGDLIPDMVTITLNDTFMVNQQLNNVVIDYKGNLYTVPASGTTLQDRTLHAPFLSKSGVDPVPSGSVMMNILVEGRAEQSSRIFTDGVGPGVISASLAENLSEAIDTLSIEFSEEIDYQALTETSLQLIRNSGIDTVTLSVSSASLSGMNRAMVIVSASNGIRPQAGDLLRLLPGVQGGSVIDKSGNKPHLLNQPVVIGAKPATLTGGWYVDETADGIVDAVYMQFHRSAVLDDIRFSLSWSGPQRLNAITSENFSHGTNDAIVKVTLPDSFQVGTGIKTSGSMFLLVESISFPDLYWTIEAADSAAPVISSAIIHPGVILESQDVVPDTLEVSFSEEVMIADNTNPFILFQPPSSDYTLLNPVLLTHQQERVRYSFINVSGVEYPSSGDSIRINPASTVRDMAGLWQNNPLNRRAPVTVNTTKTSWVMKSGPNPFSPASGQSLAVLIASAASSRIKPVVSSISLSIYDAIGNRVIKTEDFSRTPEGFLLSWNGRNRKNRVVGTGLYMGIIKVTDNEGGMTFRVKIAVK